MKLAWQLPLWKWILTDWICDETSSFYPETVISNRAMYASITAWKIFIKPLLLNTAELKHFWKTCSCSLDGSVLQYFLTFSSPTWAVGQNAPFINLAMTSNWGEQSNTQTGGLPFRGTSGKQIKGLTGICCSSSATDVNAATGSGQLSTWVQPGHWLAL